MLYKEGEPGATDLGEHVCADLDAISIVRMRAGMPPIEKSLRIGTFSENDRTPSRGETSEDR